MVRCLNCAADIPSQRIKAECILEKIDEAIPIRIALGISIPWIGEGGTAERNLAPIGEPQRPAMEHEVS
jgi:hypothetical protein